MLGDLKTRNEFGVVLANQEKLYSVCGCGGGGGDVCGCGRGRGGGRGGGGRGGSFFCLFLFILLSSFLKIKLGVTQAALRIGLNSRFDALCQLKVTPTYLSLLTQVSYCV